MDLQGFDAAAFLASNWQRKPSVIRNALPDFSCPVEGDDLAGLACEDAIDSRIITEHEGQWHSDSGPFTDTDFQKLAAKNWTLLVQGVDRWLPEVSELLEYFRFLPSWRIEDIMISYAVDGGNVGPHYDQYDVFLIQGQGRRRWKIGDSCTPQTPLRDCDTLKLLRDFNSCDEQLLEPGDILYIPPGVSHWGIAEGDDCITLSVGFRAPSHAELLGDWCDEVASHLNESQRYTDPTLSVGANPAEISDTAIAELKHILLSKLDDEKALECWFGEMMTRKLGDSDQQAPTISLSDFADRVDSGELLQCQLGARLAFRHNKLFADGICFT
ncbi:MAG: cupin domain-containing protein, partial [Spongiibacteraceae bacterium]